MLVGWGSNNHFMSCLFFFCFKVFIQIFITSIFLITSFWKLKMQKGSLMFYKSCVCVFSCREREWEREGERERDYVKFTPSFWSHLNLKLLERLSIASHTNLSLPSFTASFWGRIHLKSAGPFNNFFKTILKGTKK